MSPLSQASPMLFPPQSGQPMRSRALATAARVLGAAARDHRTRRHAHRTLIRASAYEPRPRIDGFPGQSRSRSAAGDLRGDCGPAAGDLRGLRPAKARKHRRNDSRRSGEPSPRFALVRHPLQTTRYIGATSSSWLARAVFGRFATGLQQSYRAHAGLVVFPSPTYAMLNKRTCAMSPPY
jgi:hypothetical protein